LSNRQVKIDMTVGAVGGAAVVQPGAFTNGQMQTMQPQMQSMQPQMQSMQPQMQQVKAQKPIRATEIKAYLHAWCTKQGIKPEYTYESEGKPPKVLYSCKMTIPGHNHEARSQAKSKKDAQTAAAWVYADFLVDNGKIARTDLPARDSQHQSGETDNPGGWTVDTARQRLNRFCTHYGIACNITNEVQGTPQARLTTAKVTFCVPPNNKQITATSNGPNKKNANAKCALAMIRELFKLELIERRGEPEKKPERRQNETHMTHVHGQKLFGDESMTQHGTKRKAENQLDENGNWNRGNCCERLTQFKSEMQEKDPAFTFTETTNPDGPNFKCVQQVIFGAYNFTAEGSSTAEETAKVEASLLLIVQLYKANLIDGNKRTGPNAKRYREGDDRSIYNRATSVIIMPKWGGSGRLTPWDDRHIKAKLMVLEHTIEEKNALIATAEEIEQMLKKISDELESQNPSTSAENRTLVGVMRVGAFSRGLLLKDERCLELVVQCREKPTKQLLQEVHQRLASYGSESGFQFEMHPSDGAITASKVQDENITVNTIISFTSPKFNPKDNAPEEADPANMLPRSKCVEALAETARTSFFQTKAPRLLNCIATGRILKEMARRDTDYDGLSGWLLEMLVIRSMSSARMPETVGDCLRRILSALASGIALPGNCMLPDEENEGDLFSSLTLNQRHCITYKAQEHLRYLTFRRIHEMLDIDKIVNPRRSRKNGDAAKNDDPAADVEMTDPSLQTDQMDVKMDVKEEQA